MADIGLAIWLEPLSINLVLTSNTTSKLIGRRFPSLTTNSINKTEKLQRKIFFSYRLNVQALYQLAIDSEKWSFISQNESILFQ
jgi:hypothetical protein